MSTPRQTLLPKATANRPDWRSRAALGTILLGPYLAMLDLFIVNIAAPSIQTQLHASFASVQLVISGYTVAFAMLLVTGGRLGDMAGRRRMFVIGIACFALTSTACALAPSVGVLIAMRVLQGLSAALMLPQVLALIQVLYPPAEQRRILGFYGAAMSCGSISGQVLGGLLIHVDVADLQWRAIFVVNLPFALVALAGAVLLPSGAGAGASPPGAPVRFDPVGTLLLSGAVPLLLCPLVFGAQYDWPMWVWPTLACSALMFALFFRWESGLSGDGSGALLPMRLFRLPGFAGGLPTVIAFYCGQTGFYLVLAFYLQDGIHLSPLTAGLDFLPLGVVFATASLLSRALVDRFGHRVLLCAIATIVAGLLLMLLGLGHGSHADQALRMQPGLLLCGLGQGLVLPSLLGISLRGVPADQVGAASGAVLMTSQVAGALGVAGVGAVFHSALGTGAYESAFKAGVIALVVIEVAGFLLLARLGRRAAAAPDSQRAIK
ncbi:MFS transporter [Streptomyces sp. NPDC052101]|uniref:MFS transporter n=1 Tax=Streptomyces sp. NPDC052101 TaxID=3155763 RepID=UPI003432F7B6